MRLLDVALDLVQALDLVGLDWPRDNKLECPQGHDRHSASLHLYSDTDSVYCFGCGWTADAYGLLAKLSGRPVGRVLAEYGEGWQTTTATKDLSRHRLRQGIRHEIMVATQPLFTGIRQAKELRAWQRDELLLQASYWYDALLEELLELPPFRVERKLKRIDKAIEQWLEERQVK